MKEWMKHYKTGEITERGLRFAGPVVAHTIDDAWALLPERGDGWVALADEVRPFDAQQRSGWLQQAEVAHGPRTVLLRQDRMVWKAWTWEETDGNDYRRVTWRYMSSAPLRRGKEPGMRYYTYWTLGEPVDGIRVWRPIGSRFAGWVD